MSVTGNCWTCTPANCHCEGGAYTEKVDTKLESDDWTNIRHSFAEMRLALDKATEAAGAAARSIETLTQTRKQLLHKGRKP